MTAYRPGLDGTPSFAASLNKMPMRAATIVQVLQDLFYVLLHVLFYLWSLLNGDFYTTSNVTALGRGRCNGGSAGGGYVVGQPSVLCSPVEIAGDKKKFRQKSITAHPSPPRSLRRGSGGGRWGSRAWGLWSQTPELGTATDRAAEKTSEEDDRQTHRHTPCLKKLCKLIFVRTLPNFNRL